MCKYLRIKIYSFFLATFLFFGSCFSFFSASALSYDELDSDYQAIWTAYVNYMSSVFKGCPSEAIKNLVKFDETVIATELDGVKALLLSASNVYYYLVDGVLQIDDSRASHSTHGGGGGRRRVSSGDDIYVDAPILKDIVVASNNFYFPSGKNLKVISHQNNTNYTEKNRHSHCLLNGSSSNVVFPSGSSTDIYLLPFQILGGKYYFNTNQLHISLVNGVIQPVSSLSCYDSSKVIDTSSYNDNISISSYPYMSIKYMYRDTVDYYYRIYSNGEDYVKDQNFREGWIYRSAFRAYDDTDANSATHASFMDAPDWSTDDVGYYVSDSYINMNGPFADVDPTRIPDDTFITLSGDNFYDYTIINQAGQYTTINNYITNNYYITNNDPSSGGGTVNNWDIDFPDFIINIQNSIEAAITNVFVIDQTKLQLTTDRISEGFNSKLPFVSDLSEIVKSLFIDISNDNFVSVYPDKDEDPTLYPKWDVNVTFFGKKMHLTILDFSMYVEPLYYVRLVVYIFVYIVFIVNVMKYLPTLIGGVTDMYSSVSSKEKKR